MKPEIGGGYDEVDVPVKYETRADVKTMFDSTAHSYPIVLADDYPMMAIDNLATVIGGSVENTIKSALTDGDNRNLSSGNGFKLDINGILNTSTQNTEEKFYCSVVGG